jgi:hypothetical protein
VGAQFCQRRRGVHDLAGLHLTKALAETFVEALALLVVEIVPTAGEYLVER